MYDCMYVCRGREKSSVLAVSPFLIFLLCIILKNIYTSLARVCVKREDGKIMDSLFFFNLFSLVMPNQI